MKKHKWEKKFFRFLLLVIIILSFCLFMVSFLRIIQWAKESKEIQDLSSNAQKEVIMEEVEDDETTEIVEQPKKVEKFDPYWDYIKMNLLDVDFSNLRKTNSDVIGWIQVPETNVNYPFVQANDNDYYLHHAFDKKRNSAGWIFLDYRNDLENLNQNTIIYGHGRYDRTMFGSLKNLLKSSWLKNTDNHIIKLSTEYQNTLWQIFSVYHIPTTGDYLTTVFATEEEYQKFLDTMKSRSVYQFKTTVSATDKILTLSTCYNDKEKLVVHAKLIKIQNK